MNESTQDISEEVSAKKLPGVENRFVNETAMGMVLPNWAMEPLKARLNPMHFLPIVTQSVTYSTEQAVDAGFLDTLVSEGAALDAAVELASGLAKLPGSARSSVQVSKL